MLAEIPENLNLTELWKLVDSSQSSTTIAPMHQLSFQMSFETVASVCSLVRMNRGWWKVLTMATLEEIAPTVLVDCRRAFLNMVTTVYL